jgi:biopolymer transport protein TolQ
MGLSQDLSMLALVGNASVVVQLVMGLLLVASFMSWWYIFLKLFAIKRATRLADAFETEFWSGADLNTLYQRASKDWKNTGEMERIFEAGFREFLKLRQQSNLDTASMMDGARRAMRATYQREMDKLESNLWGIMNAFRGLANVVQATLANVAPGIAEALIATAMGLFAAIPAVVAYNRYTHDIDRLANRFESFMEEFSNILQRQAFKA